MIWPCGLCSEAFDTLFHVHQHEIAQHGATPDSLIHDTGVAWPRSHRRGRSPRSINEDLEAREEHAEREEESA